MKHLILALSFLVMNFFTCYASEVVSGTIEGKVIDGDTKKPIEFVSVAVYKSSDESLVTGAMSGEDGEFTIKGVPEGQYYLELTFVGYEKKTVKDVEINDNQTEVKLKDIVLPQSVAQLNNVEVVGDEMSVEYKIDRKVINVGKQLTAASGSATDILENIPSITVDVDGNVSLRGSTGFLLLIDGRPTVMETADALAQLPANSIEKIEIITNPSAKYDPDGTAGIINIITKKDKLKGLSGTANANIGTYGRYGGGFLLNYTKKKWSVYVGADLNRGRRPGHSYTERTTNTSDTTFLTLSDGERFRERNFRMLRGGLGYNVTDNDMFNLEFHYGFGKFSGSTDQNYTESIDPGGVSNKYISYESGGREGHFYSVNLDYRHDFAKKGHNLDTRISLRHRGGNERSINELLNAEDEITSGQINTEVGPGRVFQTNVDYTLPVGEKDKFQAGYQSKFGNSVDATDLYDYNTSTEEYELLPQYSNETDYRRDIHSLYSLYAGELGNFGYQLGLRGEYTYRVINSLAYNKKYTIDRLDYFPTLHTSYKLPADQQIMASYSRRIERPHSWWLEPFLTYEDAFNVRQGNPDLNPEYIDAMEVGYLKDLGEHSLSFEGYYRITHNKVERIQSVYAENVILHKPANIGQDFALGGELVLSLNLFNWWKSEISGDVYQYRLRGSLAEQSFNRESFNWNGRLSNTFRFGKGTRIQLNGRYNSATVTAQGTRGDYWTADIAISQEMLKKKMSAILQVRDLFGEVVRNRESFGPDFHAYSEYYNLAPRVALTLNYRFNNYQRQREKNRSNGGDMGGDGEEF